MLQRRAAWRTRETSSEPSRGTSPRPGGLVRRAGVPARPLALQAAPHRSPPRCRATQMPLLLAIGQGSPDDHEVASSPRRPDGEDGSARRPRTPPGLGGNQDRRSRRGLATGAFGSGIAGSALRVGLAHVRPPAFGAYRGGQRRHRLLAGAHHGVAIDQQGSQYRLGSLGVQSLQVGEPPASGGALQRRQPLGQLVPAVRPSR
jgi:hypothetical protein